MKGINDASGKANTARQRNLNRDGTSCDALGALHEEGHVASGAGNCCAFFLSLCLH